MPAVGLSGEQHFRQKRYYDFNVRNYPQFVEKLRLTFIRIRSGPVCAYSPRTGNRAVSATTQPATRKLRISSRTGLHESAIGRQGDSIRLWNRQNQLRGPLNIPLRQKRV
jgi:hypothetical protein